MAKIPIGEFGFRTPRGGDVTPTATFDPTVGDAQQRLGGQLQHIGAGMFAEKRRLEAEQQRIAEEEKRKVEQVATLTAHANIQNGLADAYDSISSDVIERKTDKVAATAAWRDASQKVISENLKGVPAERTELVTAQVQGLQGQLQNKLFDTFRKRDQEDVSASMLTYRESQQRFAQTNPKAAVMQWNAYADQIGPAAGWTPERIAKEKQGFVEGVTYNTFRSAGQMAMQSGSVAAIEEVEKRLAGPEADAMDPARKNALSQTLFGWKQSIEARADRAAQQAEREQVKRFNVATDTLNQGREIVMNGGALAPDYIAKMANDAQGTGLEPQVQALLEAQRDVSGFANLPAADRQALLERERAARADPSKGATPQSERQMKAAEQIQANLAKGYETDPWQTAVKTAVIKAAPVVSMADVGSAMSVLQQRMAVIRDVDLAAGFKVSPLQPAEAEQLAKLAKTLKPDQAASMLGQMGALVGDAERIAGLAKQIGDKDGTLGMVMMYANAKTTEGRHTAELVLQGAQAIADKTVKDDGFNAIEWRKDIAKQVRGAFSNQEVENSMIDAAFKIAAATNGDIDRAVRLATGGVIERNGVKVPLPYGMKERDFEKRIEAITPATLADQAPGGNVIVGTSKLPLADFVKTLPDARLVHAGQGLYNVRAGNNLVTNEQGRRITIRVGWAAP